MLRNIFDTRKKQFYLLGLAVSLTALGMGVLRHRRSRQAERWQGQLQAQPARTALVTGASSGIGQAYARRLAALGSDVVLVARRAALLERLAEECRLHFGVQAEVLAADLSTPEGIARVEERIISGGDVAFLVNNAGYALYGDFAEISCLDHQGLLNCHALSSVRFCRAVLPGMLARHSGAIINVSSVGAFIPKPKDVAYGAVKAFLNRFSESLHLELAHTGVRVQSLAPGLTLSEFHDDPQYARFNLKKRVPRGLWMTPDEVVSSSLRALGEDRPVCIPGLKNRLLVAAGQVGLSTLFLRVLGRYFPF